MRRERLISARKALGKSQEQVGEEVGVDRTTIGTWERGEYTPYPHQRPAYADALCVSLTELDAMLANVPAPEDRTPVWLSQYLGMEQSATEIRAFEPIVVHGLLQTPDYAASIARSVGVVPISEAYAQRNVEQRRYRQARVESRDVQLHVIQPEIPLHLQMGSPQSMAEQMDKLLSVGAQPNVTIQIVTFAVGQYEALRMGSFRIMTHPWVEGVSVYLQPYGGLAVIEDPEEQANFAAAMDQARNLALSPDDSLAFIAEAGERWRASDG